MFGECHAHIIMDGINYKEAISLHKEAVNEEAIRRNFKAYQEQGITFVRDGGDAVGVSRRAKMLAEEYGIDYRTPVFAIHKNGHYGSIVGKGFDNMKEYAALVREAKEQGADFIKIMTTGLLDFHNHGKVTGTPLSREEVHEMVHIAHGEVLIQLAIHVFAGKSIVSFIFHIVAMIALAALIVRRFHDIGYSGWYLLAIFVPFVNFIALFVLLFFKSTPGENRYGPRPPPAK